MMMNGEPTSTEKLTEIVASTSNNGNLNQQQNQQTSFNHQLALITKKLKNAYKSRIMNSQQSQQTSNSENVSKTSGEQEELSMATTADNQSRDCIHYHHSHNKIHTKMISSANNLQHQNHHQCSTLATNKSSNKIQLEMHNDKNLKKNNKDVLILRICDLDETNVKNKIEQKYQKSPKIKI